MPFFKTLEQCYLIAEIGVNHGGDLSLAKTMVEEAKKAGADAVKFQTFTAENLVTNFTPKVEYQKQTTPEDETHYNMIKSLELSRDDHYLLKEFCESLQIDFISTPYDIESAQFLTDLGVKIIKIASADIVDIPLLEYVASTKISVILSAGMATLGEIEQAINIFNEAGSNDFVLLHCVSNYPCQYKSLNMKVLTTYKTAFNVVVGFSDHSIGPVASILSIALGAIVVEKHFTTDKSLPGPDHRASSTPNEFSELASYIRTAEESLGTSIKLCHDEEREMAKVSRKSVVLARSVKVGEIITKDHLTTKRPGTGISPINIRNIIGKKTRNNLQKDSLIKWSDLEELI
ncbi:MAG: N-acetylneuraminate synthase [Chlorobi bacterium]|nr:N-acetylneuraminate synthase [Chlorobiota bacterium]